MPFVEQLRLPAPEVLARTAAICYLIPVAPFALLYVPAKLIVAGDPAATASNIIAHEWLFKLGIAAGLATAVLMLVIVVNLYYLLRANGQLPASLMLYLVLAGVPLAVINEAHRITALMLLQRPPYVGGIDSAAAQGLAMLHLVLYSKVHLVAHIFWGAWLLPLGLLVLRSGYIPRILGILLVVAGVGYMIHSLAALFIPGYDWNIIFVTSWGELLFPIWLLTMGPKALRRHAAHAG